MAGKKEYVFDLGGGATDYAYHMDLIVQGRKIFVIAYTGKECPDPLELFSEVRDDSGTCYLVLADDKRQLRIRKEDLAFFAVTEAESL